MGEVLGVVLGVLVVVSLAAIGCYLMVAVAVSVSTLLRARRDRQMADELDRLLEVVLGPRTVGVAPLRRAVPPIRRD